MKDKVSYQLKHRLTDAQKYEILENVKQVNEDTIKKLSSRKVRVMSKFNPAVKLFLEPMKQGVILDTNFEGQRSVIFKINKAGLQNPMLGDRPFKIVEKKIKEALNEIEGVEVEKWLWN